MDRRLTMPAKQSPSPMSCWRFCCLRPPNHFRWYTDFRGEGKLIVSTWWRVKRCTVKQTRLSKSKAAFYTMTLPRMQVLSVVFDIWTTAWKLASAATSWANCILKRRLLQSFCGRLQTVSIYCQMALDSSRIMRYLMFWHSACKYSY